MDATSESSAPTPARRVDNPDGVRPGRPRCRWAEGLEPVTGAGNVYVNVLDAVVSILPVVSAPALATAREATRLLARSIVCADRVIDRDAAPAALRESMLAAQVCQLEATRLLQTIVPLDHPFWTDLVARVREFADACVDEGASGARSGIDEVAAERIAIGKNAVARLVAPMVCVLGGTMAPAAQLDSTITDLIITVQALDDAVDWRVDLVAGRLSLITARIWLRLGELAPINEIQRYVHDQAMPEVLSRGRNALSRAIATPLLQGSEPWQQFTGQIVNAYERVLAMFR